MQKILALLSWFFTVMEHANRNEGMASTNPLKGTSRNYHEQ